MDRQDSKFHRVPTSYQNSVYRRRKLRTELVDDRPSGTHTLGSESKEKTFTPIIDLTESPFNTSYFFWRTFREWIVKNRILPYQHSNTISMIINVTLDNNFTYTKDLNLKTYVEILEVSRDKLKWTDLNWIRG